MLEFLEKHGLTLQLTDTNLIRLSDQKVVRDIRVQLISSDPKLELECLYLLENKTPAVLHGESKTSIEFALLDMMGKVIGKQITVVDNTRRLRKPEVLDHIQVPRFLECEECANLLAEIIGEQDLL